MDHDTFLNDDNWLGSYYELCLELGPAGDDNRLKAALAHLWKQPQLQGSWTRRTDYDKSPPLIEIVEGFSSPRYGTLALTRDLQVGCVTHTIRETDGSDWLDLCIPTGMLELVFDTRYPLEYAANPWMRSIDQELARIAVSMFRSFPFLMGLIGEEASGLTNAESVTADDCRYGPYFLPHSLWLSLGLNCHHEVVTPGLIAIGLPET